MVGFKVDFSSGYLTETELENYIAELLPSLYQLDGLEKSFHSFYLCTAVRKFLFFLDPIRANRVGIICSVVWRFDWLLVGAYS